MSGITIPKITDLVDLQIGSVWESPTGCVPDIGGTQSGSGYKWAADQGFLKVSPEFDWGGLGSDCAMCMFQYGYSDCGPSVHGKRPRLTRTRYLGDPSKCCLSGGKLDGNNTCNPDFREGPLSNGCNSVFANYCDKDKIFKDPKCQLFAGRLENDPAWGKQIYLAKKNHCTENPTDPLCAVWGNDSEDWKSIIRTHCANNMGSNFCKDNLVKYGGADSEVKAWCASHPKDPFCSCLQTVPYNGNDPLIKEILQNTPCYDPECQKYGYKTTNQRSYVCPSTLNICSNSINAAVADKSKVANLLQQCDIKNSRNQDVVNPQSTTSTQKIPTFVLIFIILIIFIVFTLVVLIVKRARGTV